MTTAISPVNSRVDAENFRSSLDLLSENYGQTNSDGPDAPENSNLAAESAPSLADISCPRCLTLSLYDLDSERWHLFEVSCKVWDCPVCGPRKTWHLCRRIATAKPNRFLTLTSHHHASRTPKQVWDETRFQLPELIRTLRKRTGPLEYCRVIEETKSGYPHYHLLLRSGFIPQQTISTIWQHLTGAFIVDIRKVDPNLRVASYIAKYLAKQTKLSFTNRRVTQSRGFFPTAGPVEPSPYNWIACNRTLGSILTTLDSDYSSYDVEWITPAHAVFIGGKPRHAVAIRTRHYRPSDSPYTPNSTWATEDTEF